MRYRPVQRLWLSFALLPLLGLVTSLQAAQPFCPGERLEYRLFWEAVPGGAAVFEILPFKLVNGRPSWHFRVEVRSSFLGSLFHKVRTEAHAYLALDLNHSLAYELHRQEGRHRESYTLVFDWQALTATRISSDIAIRPKPLPVAEGTFDPWGVFTAFRSRPEKASRGDVLRTPVSDGEKLVMAELAFYGTEQVQVPAGEFTARLLIPDLKDVATVFSLRPGTKLRVWVSDDNRRIPVRFAGKAMIGTYSAELVRFEMPKACPAAFQEAQKSPGELPTVDLRGDAAPGPAPGPGSQRTGP
mgnify:FL=1